MRAWVRAIQWSRARVRARFGARTTTECRVKARAERVRATVGVRSKGLVKAEGKDIGKDKGKKEKIRERKSVGKNG